MKKLLMLVLSVMFAAGLCGMVVAGSLEPTGPPTAGSGMYSLSQIYDYLNSGIEATPVPSFQEPLAAPGPTMKTTKEIYDTLHGILSQSDVTADNVESGKKFFCNQPGSWGIRTGTLAALPRPTATPTPTPTITPTPTWGQTRCESAPYNGKWRATQLSAPDYGCWIYGNGYVGQSCNAVCAASNMNCVAMNWDDSPSCDICHEFVPSITDCGSDTQGNMPLTYMATNCFQRADNVAQACNDSQPDCRRFCVCAPN